MSDNNAKIRISLKDGEFELSGSELFVSQQITSFRELIVESLQKQKFELKTPNQQTLPEGTQPSLAPGDSSEIQESNGGSVKTATNFQRVFHVDNGTIKIIKRAPGNNNSQKSVNTALIYVWAKNSLGQDEVTFPEIRELCKDQGCLDEGYFSGHMKSAKEEMVLQGKGKFIKVKLTLPGKEKALSLIEELNK